MSTEVLAAGRYAQAAYDLATDLKKTREVKEALAAFCDGLKKIPQSEKLLLSPGLSQTQKLTVLEKLFPDRQDSLQSMLFKFFGLLVSKNRFYLIHDICRLYGQIADAAQQEAVLEIRSAVSLDEKTCLGILEKAQKRLGYKLRVETAIDPSILGGIVLRVGNRIFDGSVKGKLSDFRRHLSALKVA